MTCLVTGATGFIGRRLLRSSDRALVRVAGATPNFIVGDLCDSDSLIAACKNIDVVIHCAGYAHSFQSSDLRTQWQINYEGTRNILNAAVENGVKQFIFLSSVKAMSDPHDCCVDEGWSNNPQTHYGCAKLAAENAVLEAGDKHGITVTNLRLAMVYGHGGRGNLERMAAGIRAGWFPPLPETNNRRSLIHVNDVVWLIRSLLDRPAIINGKTYIVADQDAYSGRQIYNVIRQSLGKSTIYWEFPEKLLHVGALTGDMLGYVFNKSLSLNSDSLNRLLRSACYSPLKIQEELGWKAKIGLLEGVQEMLGFNV